MLLVLVSCAGPETAYRRDMFEGTGYLRAGDYGPAKESFLKAADVVRTPASFAFAATASYKKGDLDDALRYVQEAERVNGRSFAALRIAAYRALVLLKSGRTEEGLTALKAYTDLYRRLLPTTTIQDVERMYLEKHVDLPVLEKLIDEQVNLYESEIRQLHETGTGYLGNRYEQQFLGP
jgi:tetratricopeptide (TPR) repeat protein